MNVARFATACFLLLIGVNKVGAGAPAVNYVSADAVYVNVGRLAGLVPGTSIAVVRDGKQIATLEAVHVASHSASCKVVQQTEAPRAGDRVVYERVATAAPEETPIEQEPETQTVRRTTARTSNRVRGYLAFQHMWIEDRLGSGSGSSLQPALSARFVVANLLGTGAGLFVRFRSRMNYRPLTAERDWSHRLTE
ncbi:MAG: hypothetical protein PVF33_11520, partial [Candidatus Latescibacterota bacterium]